MKLLKWTRSKLGENLHLQYADDGINWKHYKNSPFFEPDTYSSSGYRTAQNLLRQGYRYLNDRATV